MKRIIMPECVNHALEYRALVVRRRAVFGIAVGQSLACYPYYAWKYHLALTDWASVPLYTKWHS